MKLSQGPLLSLFDDDQDAPLQQRLFDRLRAAILQGALRTGDRLPSTRTLAADLSVSRNTVVAAIDRLVAEGYLESRVGSGTFVCRTLPDDALRPALRLAPTVPTVSSRPATVPAAATEWLPFQPGIPALDSFDIETWRRVLAKRWRDAAGLLLGQDTDGGWYPLRRLLAAHLQTSRAVHCDPDQILILPDRRTGLELVAGLLLGPTDQVLLADGGCPLQRAVFAGRARIALAGGDGDGMLPDPGGDGTPRPHLTLVNPSWPQPLGGVMPLRRRVALLAAVRQGGGWVLEDEYDGGWRYGGRPLPSLQGLDEAGRVLHLGGLERTLVPVLRLSWLVLPPTLVEPARRLRAALGILVPLPEQMAVHDFIQDGHYASHLRRTRLIHAERQQALLDAAARYWQGMILPQPAEAGLHLTAPLAPGLRFTDGDIASAAARHRLSLTPLSGLRARPDTAEGPGALILGYAPFTPPLIEKAARRLGEVLERLTSGNPRAAAPIRRLMPAE